MWKSVYYPLTLTCFAFERADVMSCRVKQVFIHKVVQLYTKVKSVRAKVYSRYITNLKKKKTMSLIISLWQKLCVCFTKGSLITFLVMCSIWFHDLQLIDAVWAALSLDGSIRFRWQWAFLIMFFFFSFHVPYWTCRMVSLSISLNVLMQLMRDVASWRIYWLCDVTRQSSTNVPGYPSFYPYKRTRKTQPGNNNCTYIWQLKKKVLSSCASCRTLEKSPRVLWLCQVNGWSTLVTSLDD